MKIIFVRHGKDDDKYRGGWSGLDLTAEGIEQAKKLAKHLKENNSFYNITKIISSDLQRAMTTANYISKDLNLTIVKDKRLREINNGESPNDFYIRIKNWFTNFISECQQANGNVLIVTHSGVINIIYHIIKGVEWSNKNTPFKISNCSVHVLDCDKMEFEESQTKLNEYFWIVEGYSK